MTVMDLRDDLHYTKGEEFEGIKVINSTTYQIGQKLSKSETDRIIHGGTQVTVVPYKK
jgi:hypothetical protein